MRYVVLSLFLTAALHAQTADELVARNLQARGGIEKIKAIQSLRMKGKLLGDLVIDVTQESARPNFYRQDVIIQGMTAIRAYDGSSGWQVQPFGGRRDPELLGEDDMRELVEEADFDGPLVDYQAKGNSVEYLGHDLVDGDDALRLKVTLRNGDIVYYYLDPDTYIEIRTEKQQFIRGAMRETQTDLGSYKPVNGVMYPFSIESGSKINPQYREKISITSIEANIAINDSDFKMPASPAGPQTQKHPEAPNPKGKPGKTAPAEAPATKPPKAWH